MTELIFPEIRGGKVSIDSETEDKGLANELGPGWAWEGGGEMLGISFHFPESIDPATQKPYNFYASFGHIEDNNCDRSKALDFLVWILDNPDFSPCFAHAAYDLGWTRRETYKLGREFKTKRLFDDVLIMAPLIDELKFQYNLDSLGLEYLDRRKNEEELEKYANSKGWKTYKDKLKFVPGGIVGRYANVDTDLTSGLREKFEPLIIAEKLDRVYHLEQRLVPLLLEMRWRGVRVDIDKAVQIGKKYNQIMDDCVKFVKSETGKNIELTKAGEIAEALKIVGIECPTTPKTGKPSVKNAWLQSLDHPVAKRIARARQYRQANSMFIEGGVLRYAQRGRVHATFNQLKADRDEDNKSTGAVSGRFSSVEPNLQQIPGRDEEIGPEIRSLYLPEDGERWATLDYASQEPRVMVHFSELAERNKVSYYKRRQWNFVSGAIEFAEAYRANPSLDFHEKTRDAVRLVIPGFERKPSKTIGLGIAYGMGGGKLCRGLGLPTIMVEMKFKTGAKTIERAGPEGQKILDAFDSNVPFLRGMAECCSYQAQQRGYISTPTGRKFHFPKIGGEHYYLHKAFNRLVQGTSACMMKSAMVVGWEDYEIVPLATVHDELDISFGEESQLEIVKKVMTTAFPLNIPILLDVGIGDNWGEAM